MASISVVKGRHARVTKIDRCGKPIQGQSHTIVTDGYIRARLAPNMNAATDIELKNAEGRVRVKSRTPAERKWWDVTMDFASVMPELYSLLLGWEMIVDHNGNPIGIRDREDVDSEYGAAIELWTLPGDDDECDDLLELTDSIFSQTGSGASYGYLLFGATEFTHGEFGVAAEATTFPLTARTTPMKRWGRGPFNVAGIDDAGTPGRMLAPTSKKEHITFFKTPVKPPEPTNGACPLAVQSIFTGPGKAYFGADAADVAPPQPICGGNVYDVVITGTGNWTASVAGQPTANVPHTALPAALRTAIEALPNVAVGQVEVTGVAGNYDVTLAPELGAFSVSGAGLTGGTAVATPH